MSLLTIPYDIHELIGYHIQFCSSKFVIKKLTKKVVKDTIRKHSIDISNTPGFSRFTNQQLDYLINKQNVPINIFKDGMLKVLGKTKQPLKHKYGIGTKVFIWRTNYPQFMKEFAEIIGLTKHTYKCRVFRTTNVFRRLPNINGQRIWELSLVGFHEEVRIAYIRSEDNIESYEPIDNNYTNMCLFKKNYVNFLKVEYMRRYPDYFTEI